MALSDWWPWIVFPTFSTYQVMKIILNCSSVFKQQPNEYARVEFLKSLYTWLPEHSRLMHSLIILCLQTALKNKIKPIIEKQFSFYLPKYISSIIPDDHLDQASNLFWQGTFIYIFGTTQEVIFVCLLGLCDMCICSEVLQHLKE